MSAVTQLDSRFPADDDDFILSARENEKKAVEGKGPVCGKCRAKTFPCVNVLTKRQRSKGSRLVWACQFCGRRLTECVWGCGVGYQDARALKKHEEDRCALRKTTTTPSSSSSSDGSAVSREEEVLLAPKTRLATLWLAGGNRQPPKRRPRLIQGEEVLEECSHSSAMSEISDDDDDDISLKIRWVKDAETNTEPEGSLSFVKCRIYHDGPATVSGFLQSASLWRCVYDDGDNCFFLNREDLVKAANRAEDLGVAPKSDDENSFLQDETPPTADNISHGEVDVRECTPEGSPQPCVTPDDVVESCDPPPASICEKQASQNDSLTIDSAAGEEPEESGSRGSIPRTPLLSPSPLGNRGVSASPARHSRDEQRKLGPPLPLLVDDDLGMPQENEMSDKLPLSHPRSRRRKRAPRKETCAPHRLPARSWEEGTSRRRRLCSFATKREDYVEEENDDVYFRRHF